MPAPTEYVLGGNAAAAERLEIQDVQFGPISELLLDDLHLRPNDRVVEFGVGAGGYSRRILRRLGKAGVNVGVDCTASLLEQARQNVARSGCGEARFEPIVGDVTQPGPWLEGADVVTGRAILHHIPLVEEFVGRLRIALRPGTRVGFLELEFRALLGRFTVLEATGRPELAPLRLWAEGISRFYQLSGLSPVIGATLAWAFEAAGYRNIQTQRCEFPTNETVIANWLLYYDEIREKYMRLGIMTADEIDEQKRQLRALPPGKYPAVYGMYAVSAIA